MHSAYGDAMMAQVFQMIVREGIFSVSTVQVELSYFWNDLGMPSSYFKKPGMFLLFRGRGSRIDSLSTLWKVRSSLNRSRSLRLTSTEG